MELRSWIKVVVCTGHGRHDSLVTSLELPPGCVVLLWGHVTPEHIPSPLVHKQAKGQLGQLEKGLSQ
jgi:hypothetical protein